MSTLFLIGNGFDLNCGMKTRYADVYEKYVNELSNSKVIERFKDSISGNFDTWGDFEMAMAEYAKNLDSEAEFLECINDFAIYMERYLIEESNTLKQLLKDKTVSEAVEKSFEESLKNFYTNISHNIDVTMQLRHATYLQKFEAISFNYTDVFDVLWHTIVRPYNNHTTVTHIHGILNDGPVFGVDNVNQINANYELTRKGKRRFIKPIFNSEYDEHRVIRARSKIKNASTICAYGMSLGDSDLSWRNEIIEWLKADKEHHLFAYRYSYSKQKYYTIPEKLDAEDEAKEQLFLEWGIDEMDELFNQVHIPCGKNIFDVGAKVKEALRISNASKNMELQRRIEKGEKFVKNNVLVTP